MENIQQLTDNDNGIVNRLIGHNNVIPNTAYEIMRHPLEKDIKKNQAFTQIYRNADATTIEHLIFTSNKNMTIEEFINCMNNASLRVWSDMQNEQNSIMKIDFSFLMKLNLINQYNMDTFTVKIPADITFGEIYLISLDYVGLYIRINNIDVQLFESIDVVCNYRYIDNPLRKRLEKEYHSNSIQIINKCSEVNITNNNCYKLDIKDQSGITKGYFMEGDLCNLDSFCIRVNGYDRFASYDQVMIDLYCKITENLYYFSYTNKHNYEDLSTNSYVGSPNTQNINELVMLLKFNGTQKNSTLKIYSVSKGLIHYQNGFTKITNI